MTDLLYGGLVVLSEFLFPMQPVLLKSYKYNSLKPLVGSIKD